MAGETEDWRLMVEMFWRHLGEKDILVQILQGVHVWHPGHSQAGCCATELSFAVLFPRSRPSKDG